MANVKVEAVGKVYRVTQEDGEELTLFDTVISVPQPTLRLPVPEKALSHEETTETTPVKNPFSKKHFNLTQQAQLKKRDPEEYQRLKAAAD